LINKNFTRISGGFPAEEILFAPERPKDKIDSGTIHLTIHLTFPDETLQYEMKKLHEPAEQFRQKISAGHKSRGNPWFSLFFSHDQEMRRTWFSPRKHIMAQK
jgi:hypothetical protein